MLHIHGPTDGDAVPTHPHLVCRRAVVVTCFTSAWYGIRQSYLSSLPWEAQCGPPRRAESARTPAEARQVLQVRTADSNHPSNAVAPCPAVPSAMPLRACVVPYHIAAMSAMCFERQHWLTRAPAIFLTPVTVGVWLWGAAILVYTYLGVGSRRPHRGLAVLCVHDWHTMTDSRRGWCRLQFPPRPQLSRWTASFVRR